MLAINQHNTIMSSEIAPLNRNSLDDTFAGQLQRYPLRGFFMGRKRMDITGHVCGRLTVLEFTEMRASSSFWRCRCECGNVREYLGSRLRSGATKSCGCLVRDLRAEDLTKHGHALGGGSPEYKSWASMKARCNNPSHHAYHNYGGRGIEVCKRWESFENFLEDMGKRPEGKNLDRIDNNGNYELSNCRWITQKENARNTRKSKWWFVDGVCYDSAISAAKVLGVSSSAINHWCDGYEGRNNFQPPKEGCYSELKYNNKEKNNDR